MMPSSLCYQLIYIFEIINSTIDMIEERLSKETRKCYAESRRKWTYQFQLIEIEENEDKDPLTFDNIDNHQLIVDHQQIKQQYTFHNNISQKSQIQYFPSIPQVIKFHRFKKLDSDGEQIDQGIPEQKLSSSVSFKEDSSNIKVSEQLKFSYKLILMVKGRSSEYGPFTRRQYEADSLLLYENKVIKTSVMITEDLLIFIEKAYAISKISKIKLLPLSLTNQTKLWIKFQYKTSSVFFMNNAPTCSNYEAATLILYKIVTKRMRVDSQKTALEPQGPNRRDKREDTLITFNNWICGKIYKRSQILGKWMPRFVVVKHNGIYSYRNPQLQDEYSFHISRESIRYIWTRFQTYSQENLIIKIKHGIQKTEFAIPIINFTVESQYNWLHYFCKLLS